jgi:hypothetical protein
VDSLGIIDRIAVLAMAFAWVAIAAASVNCLAAGDLLARPLVVETAAAPVTSP